MANAGLRDSPFAGCLGWTLRGVGQVVLQNNPWSGLVILLGLLVNSWIYALICVVGVLASTATAIVAAWLWASIAIFLQPISMPVLTSAFVLVTWLMLIGQQAFKALVPVAPAEATTPEQHRQRYLASRAE